MIYTEYDYMPQTDGDSMTALWDQHWDGRTGWNPDYTREPLWRTISDVATGKPGRLLEAGCGVGKWISYFNRMGHWAIGVDYAPSGLRVAAANDPTLATVRCDCRALPFESDSFDYVFAAGTVEHDPAGPEAALREFCRVLRPGGWLMSSVPCLNVERHLMLPWMLLRDFLKRRAVMRRIWGKKDPYVFYEYVYSPASYRRVLNDCGFEVVNLRPYGELNDLPLLPQVAANAAEQLAVLLRPHGHGHRSQAGSEREIVNLLHAEPKLDRPAISQRPLAASAGSSPPSLCVVSHFAYGALSGGAAGRLVGGVEWQTSLTARWLAARGWLVTMLTWDEGQGDDTEIDGVRVIKICRRDAGLPGVRFFMPRWSGLIAAMRRADADVYYHNCGEYVTGQVALWCRRNGRGFVYSVASDPDCDARLPQMKTLRERVLYRFGLRNAGRIVVQTEKQRRMLRDGFGLDSLVIPMPCVGPDDSQILSRQHPTDGAARVAWVGRVVPLKRLEWLLDIAERLPQVQFDVVGPPDPETDHTRKLFARGRAMPNVMMHGRVDRERMPEIYRAASVLCCTSEYEGFPNTFLEAFSHGVPVVSTVDPDMVIARQSLGGTGASVEELSRSIGRLIDSPADWRAASRAAREYFRRNHAVDVVMPRFAEVFADAAGEVLRRRGAGA